MRVAQDQSEWNWIHDLTDEELERPDNVDRRKFDAWEKKLEKVKHDAEKLLHGYTDSHVIMAHRLEMEIAGKWFTKILKERRRKEARRAARKAARGE